MYICLAFFGDYSSQISENLSQKEINEFNAKFYQYQSYKDENGNWQNLCRAQDVVTIANLAKQNNAKYEYSNNNKGPYYITVKVKPNNNMTHGYPYKDFETCNEDDLTKFMKENSIQKQGNCKTEIIHFVCNITINSKTGLVQKAQIDYIDNNQIF